VPLRSKKRDLTIGIFVILGSTYTGHYEPVEEVAALLDKYQEETGLDIPIHLDGASGAMFSPFATPSVKFGFEINRVKSINTYRPPPPWQLPNHAAI
jgi:glutamate decarboxylase